MPPARRRPRRSGDDERRAAVLYARVSSKEQEKEGFSIPAQQKLLRRYAAASQLEILQEFIDVETAKQAGRSGFSAMVTYLRKSSCRIVIVEKTDRLYRNLKDWVTLDELDLEIHFVKEGVVHSADSRSSEKFIHGIKVLMAKNYIDNLSEEVRKGMTEKAAQGLWPSRAPLGYRNVVGADGRKTIEPDPEQAPRVVKLFEWYATGRYSLKTLTEAARFAGLVYGKSRKPIPKSQIHKVLRNRIYTGSFDWNGKTYQGTYQPLISVELWRQVQDRMDGRYNCPTQPGRSFPYSGLVKCGHCGCALVGEIKKERYIYYHCSGARGKCPEKWVRQEVLEQHFLRAIEALHFDPEIAEWIVQALRESHVEERRFRDEAIKRLEARVARLSRRLDTLYEDRLDGRITTELYDRKADKVRVEQRELLAAIEEHQSANELYLTNGVRIIELAQEAPELFLRQIAEEKRKLLDCVLSNSTWANGELAVEYRQPFDMIANAKVEAERETAAGADSSGRRLRWLPFVDAFRTICVAPPPAVRPVLEAVGQLGAVG